MPFEYQPKSIKQLRNSYNNKLSKGVNGFDNFDDFIDWYFNHELVNHELACHYCGLTEKESQELVMTGLITSNRFPQKGVISRGKNRAIWLEIDRLNPKGLYSRDNCVLCCYFCNNDKSDVFGGNEYKKFFQNRVEFLSDVLNEKRPTENEHETTSELHQKRYIRINNIGESKMGIKKEINIEKSIKAKRSSTNQNQTDNSFKVELRITYYNEGFFNVPKVHSNKFGDHDDIIRIQLGNNPEIFTQGRINRASNKERGQLVYNGTPRIHSMDELNGKDVLINWIHSNFVQDDIMNVDILAQDSIRLNGK